MEYALQAMWSSYEIAATYVCAKLMVVLLQKYSQRSWGRKILSVQDFETSLGNTVGYHLYKKVGKVSQAQWLLPVVPVTCEAKVGGLFEFTIWRLQRAKIVPLRSSMGIWMNLETIILSKLIQEQKTKHCMFSLI
ncbi:hypothetical protein AAY473_030570, partial [Plecturocebus cupreus]